MAQGTPSWLNIDFAERILRLAEDDSTIQVIDIFTKSATAKGDNYTSDMVRVSMEFTRKQGDKAVNDKKTLIFKFEPMESGAKQDMIMKTQIFDTEILMMTDTLKKMGDILGTRLCARIFYVRMERPLCLIMEDLAPQGFRMADRQTGLDLTHSLLTMRALAKFHAASVALCEKEPKHKAVYWKGIFNMDSTKEVEDYFMACVRNMAKEVENWPELGKSYADKIKKLQPKIFEKGVEIIKRKDNEFNVINHGDCWVNNMLFRYDENSVPVEHIFVDFQLSIYTSPAIDLQYFFSSSVSEQVAENHMKDLHEEYLKTLTATMKKLGCKTPPPTMKDLQRTLREKEMYGLMMSMMILPVVVIDKSEAKDLDELMPVNGVVDIPGYKHPTFRRIMTKRLRRYDEMGLFDE